MTSQKFQDFIVNIPNAGKVRERYPDLASYLIGEFLKTKPNLFPKDNPEVGSWDLEQGKDKNPTLGIFSQREKEPYIFPTDYKETLIILEGKFITENITTILPGVCGIDPDGRKMIIADDELNLTALTDVLYFCMYDPKK